MLTSKSWDNIYRRGKHFVVTNEFFLDGLLKEIQRCLGRRPIHALDLGCGTGDLAIKLAKRGMHVVCIDGSVIAITKARSDARLQKVSAHVEFIQSDLEHLEALQLSKPD